MNLLLHASVEAKGIISIYESTHADEKDGDANRGNGV